MQLLLKWYSASVYFSVFSCLFETERIRVSPYFSFHVNLLLRFGNCYVLVIVVGKDMVEVSVRAGGKGVAANEDVFTNC